MFCADLRFAKLVLLLICSFVACGASFGEDGVRAISPPELGFFDKIIDYQGISIKASANVDSRALVVARQKLDTMLRNAPDIVFNLKERWCELHIIGAAQQPSDLPELRKWKGKPFEGTLSIDERTRGVGGRLASCGEENLLHLKGDRYYDRDICFHEFAHTLMEYGLDEELRKRIKKQYLRSKEAGLWPGCYALNNEGEFWAELSMWYFGSRGDFGKITPAPELGKEWLKRYDAEAYKLLDDIYSGRLKPQREQAETLKAIDVSKEKSMKSENGSTPIKLRFVNLTDKPLKLFWLNYDGARKFYASVEPLSEVELHTYASHPWVVTDSNDAAIAIYCGSNKNAVARIGDSKH